MTIRKFLLFLLALSCLLISELTAQSAVVTFNVNLEPQLKDSIFIPGRDWIIITGRQYPFRQSNNRLTDTVPKDSVYSITLRFNANDLNKTFNYNFVMYTDGRARREDMVRQITIERGERNLDALYFNAFAW